MSWVTGWFAGSLRLCQALPALPVVRSGGETQYKDNAIETFRPWIFLMTDGGPTDRWEHATDLVKQGETSKGFSFWGIGVENANMDILKKICTEDRPPIKLAGLQFKEMFVWLSASLKSVSGSQPVAKVVIEPPKGWTEV